MRRLFPLVVVAAIATTSAVAWTLHGINRAVNDFFGGTKK